jgi:lipid-A-disaccharide synthase
MMRNPQHRRDAGDGQPALVAMVAGEASGDFLGAHLMTALRKRFPRLRFAGIGGPKMEDAGFDSWFPMEKLAVRGYAEVLRHYAGIVMMRRKLGQRLLAARPSLFVGIDAPDFNLALERRLKAGGIPTVHYVSPSLWAWRGYRIRAIAKSVSKMLVLFPFEEAIYRKAGVPVEYVGHPLAEQIPMQYDVAQVREQLKLPPGRKIIALLPGSRQAELRYLAPVFVRAAARISEQQPSVHFLVPLVSRETRAIFEQAQYDAAARELPLTILFGHAREAIAAAHVVLVASGTASLEAALYRKPMVITYKMAETTYQIMSRMRYLPWVGLPNIIAGEFLVPELVQHEATPENLAQALLNALDDPVVAKRLPERLGRIHEMLRRDSTTVVTEALLPWLAPASSAA